MTASSKVTPSQNSVKGVTTPPSGVPLMGLAEAASACGVSVSTLRRKRSQLKDLGAAETAKGWQIPVTALITLGLMDRVTAPLQEAPSIPGMKGIMTPHYDAPLGTPSAEVEALRAAQTELREKLADAEKRAAVAEAIASERERIIQTQAMALRMLEASAPAPSTDGSVNPRGHGEPERSEEAASATPVAAPQKQNRWPALRRLLNR